MIKTLQSTLKQDREKYKIPKSVQDIIPIRRIWQDGIFQAGSKFSKSIRFTDINYAIASKEDKTSMSTAPTFSSPCGSGCGNTGPVPAA